ncbi:hypothetical protein KP509_10G037000 [Ceratopteris richardii]|uniref:Uncharacterized protein n=1 Tax=Ceratopteris richardii TaxID=49495 RepID=A0A8T2U0B6_CERRI|nr:hypothetical protein KP509_10G037000 [Ceratopteris richardii]
MLALTMSGTSVEPSLLCSSVADLNVAIYVYMLDTLYSLLSSLHV